MELYSKAPRRKSRPCDISPDVVVLCLPRRTSIYIMGHRTVKIQHPHSGRVTLPTTTEKIKHTKLIFYIGHPYCYMPPLKRNSIRSQILIITQNGISQNHDSRLSQALR